MKVMKHPGSTSIHFDDNETRSANEFWTPGKLQLSKPKPLPVVTEEGTGMPGKVMPSGIIQSVPGFDPGQQKLKGTPSEADVHQRPFWNGGKLYFVEPAGVACGSAQFCGDPNILLTAAHCLMDHKTGKYFETFTFWQAYKIGIANIVGVKAMIVMDKYFDGKDDFTDGISPYDFGFIITKSASNAGWLGWATGINYNSWTAIGYPANYQGGNLMQKVDGTKGYMKAGNVQMLGNPMRSGCSGGAWIAELNTQQISGNFAVGLNSHYHVNNNDDLDSPYFGDDFVNLYHQALALK